MNNVSIREQVWHALRIASSSMTVHELAMVVNASDSSIKLYLHEWSRLNLVKVDLAKPRQRRGRRASTYWLIDKTVVYSPVIKKE